MEHTKIPVPVRSVRKALELLELLAFRRPDASGIPLSTLSRQMGIPANTTRNLLKTMLVCGYVAQNPDSTYTVGPKCLQIGRWSRLMSEPVKRQIIAILQKLSATLQEAVVLAGLCDGQRTVFSRVEANQVVRVDQSLLEDQGIYTTPTGRILTAFASRPELEKILESHGFPANRWDDIGNEPALQETLKALHSKGVCVLTTKPTGLVALAVPVLDSNSKLLAALGCYAPAFRCPKAKQATIIREMKTAAENLAAILAD